MKNQSDQNQSSLLPHATEKIYVEVVLPMALAGTFTYHWPLARKEELKKGLRVSVAFGGRKLFTGMIWEVHNREPELYRTKSLDAVLDEEPLVQNYQLAFWQWMADYYMCSLGEVYKVALPSALKMEGETLLRCLRELDLSDDLSPEETAVFLYVQDKQIARLKELKKTFPDLKLFSIIKHLFAIGLVVLDERLKDKYRPKTVQYIQVNPSILEDKTYFEEIFQSLDRAPKQKEVILKLMSQRAGELMEVKELKALLKVSSQTLKELEKKEWVIIHCTQKNRFDFLDKNKEPKALIEDCQSSVNQINDLLEKEDRIAIKIPSGRAKRKILQHWLKEQKEQGNRGLFLVPEISLAVEISRFLAQELSMNVLVYHSKFNQNERVDVWRKALSGDFDLIIGTSSSVFLPLSYIDYIWVDQEQDTFYKQNHSKPYYHARDVAMALPAFVKMKVILVSENPSLEVINSQNKGKLPLLNFTNQIKVQRPQIQLIDLAKAYKKGEMNGFFSKPLLAAMAETLKEDKQILVFQNKRGYAPVLQCKDCGHTPFCPNCDIALNIHQHPAHLKCHYCGYSAAQPKGCYSCGSTTLDSKGLGSQQVEEALKSEFKEASIVRMDIDSMRRKHAFEELLDAFEQKEIDILVGTQMMTKGLLFSNVGLIVVVRADALLSYPHFRSSEQAFQTLYQLSGRAGDKASSVKMWIQTYQPEHRVLQNFSIFDVETNNKEVLYQRKEFRYPPYTRLIQLTFSHKQHSKVHKVAHMWVDYIKASFSSDYLLGPEPASIPRINNEYLFEVMVKIQPDQSLRKVKKLLWKALLQVQTIAAYKSVKVKINVDPY